MILYKVWVWGLHYLVPLNPTYSLPFKLRECLWAKPSSLILIMASCAPYGLHDYPPARSGVPRYCATSADY